MIWDEKRMAQRLRNLFGAGLCHFVGKVDAGFEA